MQILLNFMSKDNVQILTCINGTLYSLLKRKKFKLEAKKFNLESIIFKTDGPNKIPTRIIPTTLGTFIFSKIIPIKNPENKTSPKLTIIILTYKNNLSFLMF